MRGLRRPSAGVVGIWALAALYVLLGGLAGCATATPAVHCPPLKQAYPHTSLQQKVLADELPTDPPESQAELIEYTTIRARGDLVCPAK